MNICEIKRSDIANGPGMRVTIFVSGCTNKCPGCFQPETWDFNYGDTYDGNKEKIILDELSKPWYQGLTILGGEPFEPSNQEGLIGLIKNVKKSYPDKDIWMFTGFTYDKDLVSGGRKYTNVTDEILDNIDVLVDGRFILEKKNISLRFRGSENQRIIDMKKTREEGKVVLSPFMDKE